MKSYHTSTRHSQGSPLRLKSRMVNCACSRCLAFVRGLYVGTAADELVHRGDVIFTDSRVLAALLCVGNVYQDGELLRRGNRGTNVKPATVRKRL